MNSDVLFVLNDAGETNALMPVLPLLTEKGISYKALCIATSRYIYPDDDTKISLEREEAIQAVSKMKPKLVITGTVSGTQSEIARRMHDAGRRVIGYYDSLKIPTPTSWCVEFLPSTHEMWVASEFQKKALADDPRVKVVGQPSLEFWAESAGQMDRKEILRKLSVKGDRPLVVFAGGYGFGYERAFQIFAKSIEAFPECDFVLSVHPKADGLAEKQVLKMMQMDRVDFLPENVNTLEATCVADVLVAQRSTAGVQALFMGKPVVYVDVPETYFTNVAIQRSWCPQATTRESLIDCMLPILQGKAKTAPPIDYYQEAGIPRDSKTLIANEIAARL